MASTLKQDFAVCPKCGVVFGYWTEKLWPWTHSQWLHEDGTGHKMNRGKFLSPEHLELYITGEIKTLNMYLRATNQV